MQTSKKSMYLAQLALVGFLAAALRLTFLYNDCGSSLGQGRRMGYDAREYFTTAVNLANGDGYSVTPRGPPFLAREPGLIYFYAAHVWLYERITRHHVAYPTFQDLDVPLFWWPQEKESQGCVMLIMASQAVLQVLAVLFLYGMAARLFRPALALAVGLAGALYVPLVPYSEVLLRENLLQSLLMVTGFVFVSYWQRPTAWKAAIVGLLWGLAALTLQVYAVLGICFAVPMLWKERPIGRALVRIVVMGLVFGVTVLPWILRAYAFYPDWRVAKSLGYSYTYEVRRNEGARAQANRMAPAPLYAQAVAPPGTNDEVRHFFYDSRAAFQQTFDGSLRRESNELTRQYGTPRQAIGMQVAEFVLMPGYGLWGGFTRPSYLGLFLACVVGVFSLIGVMLCLRRYACLTPIYWFHVLLLPILMSERRRVIPIMLLIVLFAVVGLWWLIRRCRPQTGEVGAFESDRS